MSELEKKQQEYINLKTQLLKQAYTRFSKKMKELKTKADKLNKQ